MSAKPRPVQLVVTPEMLEAAQQSNQRRLAAYQAQGVNVTIPGAPLPLLELLIETVVGPQDSPEWRSFAYAYEARIRDMLDAVEPQVARARLTAPGAPNGWPPSEGFLTERQARP